MTRRLVLSYLAVTLVVLALLEIPLAIFYAQRERERVTTGVEHDAYVIASIYEDGLEHDSTLDPGPAEEYHSRTGARVVVVDRRGISRIDTDQPIGRDFSTRPEIAAALGGETTSGTRSSETLSTSIIFVAVPVASGGTVHGASRITVDTSDVTARIHRFWIALGSIAAIVLAAVTTIGWVLAQSVTRPVRHLNATAERFARGDLTVDQSDLTDGAPEIRNLAASLSTMARRLDELLSDQRRFIADASHQLRTPLTALRLRLENLQTHLDDESSAELDLAIDEVSRLGSLVTELLRLAQADEHPETQVSDLALLTAERIDTWSAVADANDVSLVSSITAQPALVRAVPGAIEQILDNLLDNAVTASPPGSSISVTITRADGRQMLTIADHGTGMTDEQKASATARFWRANTASPGTGLGLAIVEALATASGGGLHLTDTDGGGLTATVTFDAASTGPGSSV